MKRYLLFAYYTDQTSGALSNYVAQCYTIYECLTHLEDYEWYDILDLETLEASIGNHKTERTPEFQPLTPKQ